MHLWIHILWNERFTNRKEIIINIIAFIGGFFRVNRWPECVSPCVLIHRRTDDAFFCRAIH